MTKAAPKLNLKNSYELYEAAKKIYPGGVSPIRRPEVYYPEEWPVFFKRGYANHIVDVDGNDYIDWMAAYGPMILGEVEQEINDAVTEDMKKGFCFSLSQEIQIKLAKKLIEIIPCAEKVIFGKTGSDSTNMAVRIARAYTDKNKIIKCGYHGWGDWTNETLTGAVVGVPKAYQDLTMEMEYNDLENLENMLKNDDDIACIIMPPFGHAHMFVPLEYPDEGYLEGVRALADKYKAVLIFDEIRTGFRFALGGAQEYYGVTPDLGCFGKAMANGYAVSACVGKAEIMDAASDKAFISSTMYPNSLEMVAALKTIEIIERENVIEDVWTKGKYFRERAEEICAKFDVGVFYAGIEPMPLICFKEVDGFWEQRRELFYTQMVRRKIFIQPFHHGYISYRHTYEDLDYVLESMEKSLAIVAEKYPVC